MTVSAFVPYFVSRAKMAGHAVDFCAFPFSVRTGACVAILITSLASMVVSTSVQTFTFSGWYTSVGFFVNGVAWKAVTSSNTLFSTLSELCLAASTAAACSTFLIDLAGWAT